MLTRFFENHHTIDKVVTRLGEAIPLHFRLKVEYWPNQKTSIAARRNILRSVFRHHNPPIMIGRHIGSGGFADVFTATSDYEGVTDFAIKILQNDFLEIRKGKQFSRFDEEMRVKEFKQRFKNESYVQWDLSQSVKESVANSVVRVYDHGEFDSINNFRFILMERMDLTLRDYINNINAVSSEKELLCHAVIMTRIAEKIANVHQEGIFHRDIKPENILFPKGKSPRTLCPNCDKEFQCHIDVRIGDFGTVRWEKSYSDKFDAVIIGSQLYMSPEQIFNPKTIDKRTDIYSFGVICYEMLYGQHPKNVNQNTPDFLEKLAIEPAMDQIPPPGFGPLHDIISKCMLDRRSRYQSMTQVLHELNEFLLSKGIALRVAA